MSFHSRSLIVSVFLGAATLLAGCATTQNNAADSDTARLQQQAQLAASATTVLQQQMLQPSQRRIPSALVDKARCIAVFPSVKQAGLIFSASRGRGLISCRQRSGTFNDAAPAVYTLSAASFGLQAGAAERAVVLLFTTQQSTRAVYDSLVKLGSQVSVSAGPSGYDQPINSAAPIVAYGMSRRGLFAGLNLGGGKVSFDKAANTAIYDTADPDPRQILLERSNAPQSMQAYVDTLEKFTRAND
ncbi:lipid-binding SYLF domain-containing protein [Salinisphaera sp. Q1T1-3]|uniref:lipid-binding SYLF domain-containing protein n=1 Tax=Salinisphaera sp. Q1T1-3 TaxID=2321229 RepID=UPI000E707613|nr:lipid-binding SYLF domain-containing protein [Salinisphaera sp. Q1T1-3]RJS94074.1 hypothetical protein D3260_05755 [Salinisphaera sp. Q1T1-3]